MRRPTRFPRRQYTLRFFKQRCRHPRFPAWQRAARLKDDDGKPRQPHTSSPPAPTRFMPPFQSPVPMRRSPFSLNPAESALSCRWHAAERRRSFACCCSYRSCSPSERTGGEVGHRLSTRAVARLHVQAQGIGEPQKVATAGAHALSGPPLNDGCHQCWTSLSNVRRRPETCSGYIGRFVEMRRYPEAGRAEAVPLL